MWCFRECAEPWGMRRGGSLGGEGMLISEYLCSLVEIQNIVLVYFQTVAQAGLVFIM